MPHALQELVTAAVLFLPRLGVSILTFVGFWVAAAVLEAILGRFGNELTLVLTLCGSLNA